MGVDKGGNRANNEEKSDSGYISKEEPIGFAVN